MVHLLLFSFVHPPYFVKASLPAKISMWEEAKASQTCLKTRLIVSYVPWQQTKCDVLTTTSLVQIIQQNSSEATLIEDNEYEAIENEYSQFEQITEEQ